MKTEIAIAGMKNSWRFCHGSSKNGTYASGGTQWKTREVKISSSVASQKFGMLMPIRPVTARSSRVALSRRTAEMHAERDADRERDQEAEEDQLDVDRQRSSR